MDDVEPDPQLAQLTAEMAWLRRLARALLRTDEADDLAQDAWLVATERQPTDGRPLRPWLHRVVLNLVRMQARGRRRRELREHTSASLAEPTSTPAALVQRVELQRLVAGEALNLAEPYRSTVLMHFFEELSCAEIARRLDVPEGTVRRRLKVALDELRARIDRRERKSGGLAALAPLAGIGTNAQPVAPVAVGMVAMKKLLAILVVLLLILLGAVVWKGHGSERAKAGNTGEQERQVAAHAVAATPGADAQLPAWLSQLGVEPRRIAGRVTFRGAPVSGATVELASIASESGLIAPPRQTTNAAGEFDFGRRAAMAWSVRASAPGKANASAEVDLREPSATPSPEHLEIALGACDAAMFGTIRDASGGPVAKARVARLPADLLLPRMMTKVPGGASVVSDEKGSYELCVETRWPGWTFVEVSADGYAAITHRTLVPGRVKVDFALVPEATIVGRVIRDDTGKPVPQAYVFVPFSRTAPMRGVFTDRDGRFRIDGVTAGRHLVFARAEGMAETVRGTPVVVGVGQTSVEIEIRLEAGSTLRGRVVEHSKAVVGARVSALDGFGSRSSAVSQDDGSFVLTGVPHGEIQFTAPPYDVVSPSTFRVTQAAHEGLTIEVESRGTIIGHVVRGKAPVPGANIDIHGPNDNELDEIRADANGRFEARGLRPGPWTLFASDDRAGAFGRAPETVNLSRGQTAEVTIDLAYAASISGRVIDQNGSPVPGVTVIFRNTKSDDSGITATSTDGTFRAATMTGGGEYRPAVTRNLLSSELLRPASGTEFPLVTLSDGNAEVTGIVLAVHLDHLSISGTVVDSVGAPVPDARVIAVFAGGDSDARSPHATQDPADTASVDGHFSIGDLTDGKYMLLARSPAGVTATLGGVQAGRSDVAIVLPTPGSLEVTTIGFKTTPQVGAVPATDSSSSAPIMATPQGTVYVLRNLSPGSYLVTANAATEAASTVVQVAAGQTSRATLTSGGSGVVAGRVHDFRTGKPVEGMACGALPRVGVQAAGVAPGDDVRTDSQGTFLIGAAPAGPIEVWCGGLWRNYSDGVRLLALAPSQRIDVDVPVVARSEEAGTTMGGIGADFDETVLIPQLVRVEPGGPAAAAGFQNGDLIVTVDGASVAELSPRGVWMLLVNRPPGTKVKVGATRAGKPVNGEITLGAAPL